MKTFVAISFLFSSFLPGFAWAVSRDYTESSPIGISQTQADVKDALLAKIRQDALNDTGVYIKKTATMDEHQNLSESTTITMARLIKIDSKSVHSVLTPHADGSSTLSVTATVEIDDNELKSLASKEHALALARLQNTFLQHQITVLLQEKANKDAQNHDEKEIADAGSITPGPAAVNPSVTLQDLVANVPEPVVPRQAPSVQQACQFFRTVWNDIETEGIQNHLQARLIKQYRNKDNPDQVMARVRVSGSIDWDWSKEATLMKDFMGRAYFGDDHLFGLVPINDLFVELSKKENADLMTHLSLRLGPDAADDSGLKRAHNAALALSQAALKDLPAKNQYAYRESDREIVILVTFLDGRVLYSYDSLTKSGMFQKENLTVAPKYGNADVDAILSWLAPMREVLYRHSENIDQVFDIPENTDLSDQPLVNVHFDLKPLSVSCQ